MLHSLDGVLWVCWVCAKCNILHLGLKNSMLVSLRHKTFCHMALESLAWCCAYLKNDSRWAFLSHGFLLATLPYMPDLWSAWDIVVTCTQWPVFSIKTCSSFKVAIGLLVASLVSLLLAWSSSLEGRSDLGRVLVVPYTFHFLMIALTVLQGIFKAFKIFFYPSTDLCVSTTLSRRSFESSLVFMVESLQGNALPSRGNLQEQLILFWN